MKDAGTSTTVSRWAKTLPWRDESTVELVALDASGAQVVTSWQRDEILAGLESWAESVCALATDDTSARACTTRYELRHRVGDLTRGVAHLRRVHSSDREEETMDTSANGLLALLLKTLAQKDAQLLEASRIAQQGMASSMNLLAQSMRVISELQARNVEQHETMIQATPDEPKTDPFRTMLETVGPHLAGELAKNLLGGGPTKPS